MPTFNSMILTLVSTLVSALISVLSSVLIFAIFQKTAMATPAIEANGMVVSISQQATQAGVQILKAGGNAADAAVATAFALAVTKPYFGSIGGGGFMLVKFRNREAEALDYRERAPLKSTPEMFLKNKDPEASETGVFSVGTPGSVAGLFALHQKYGKLPWGKDINPAVKLAEKGFPVSHDWVSFAAGESKRFNQGALDHFAKTKNGQNQWPKVGDILIQPGLAQALKAIQKNGAKGFYEGPVAQDIVRTLQDKGGIMSLQDLKDYKVHWGKPLETHFKGRKILTMPLPSSGGVFLVELLALADKINLQATKPLSADEYHLMAESMARVSKDRFALGDPLFSSIPIAELLGQKHLDQMASEIKIDRKTKVTPPTEPNSKNAPHEGSNTTHYVVVDKDGQTVSATTTLNGVFGSGVVTNRYGIALNDEMDDFNTKPGKPNMFGLMQGDANKVEPLKTPLSSMTPTLIFDKDGELEMALGSPGGPKIISAVFQVVYHALTTDWDIEQLILAPRVHHQYLPDKIYYDSFGVSPDTLSLLTQKGHTLSPAVIARVYGIRRTKQGLLEGAADRREEGTAAGY